MSEKLLQKAFGCKKTSRVGKNYKHEFTVGDLMEYSVVRPESKIIINVDTHKNIMNISFDAGIKGQVIAKDLRILADMCKGKVTLKKN
jgi:hypothetical protein